MNSNQADDKKTSVKRLRLPKPDPANITVLIDNAPNKPIFPWNHYDSPWLEAQTKNSESENEQDRCE